MPAGMSIVKCVPSKLPSMVVNGAASHFSFAWLVMSPPQAAIAKMKQCAFTTTSEQDKGADTSCRGKRSAVETTVQIDLR